MNEDAAPSHISPKGSQAPAWMSWVLRIAGIYNLAWGAYCVLLPQSYFQLVGLKVPDELWLWQCIGMIVGVYGVGYWIAASDPYRHWPITFVGFLGKLFGPIGLVFYAVNGVVPWAFGWTNLTNDVVWLVPFSLILLGAAKAAQARTAPPLSLTDGMKTFRDQNNQSLEELSRSQPRLLVFLRHAGCTFCREALADIQKQRSTIEAQGLGIVLISMLEPAEAKGFFAKYGLDDLPRISDPQRQLYAAFELHRGNVWQLLGPHVWWRGAKAFFGGHGLGRLQGDGFQMPGAFVLADGKIVQAFRHRTAADRPDYAAMATEACAIEHRSPQPAGN